LVLDPRLPPVPYEQELERLRAEIEVLRELVEWLKRAYLRAFGIVK
jgi:AMMECR1 domain-containing protein